MVEDEKTEPVACLLPSGCRVSVDRHLLGYYQPRRQEAKIQLHSLKRQQLLILLIESPAAPAAPERIG